MAGVWERKGAREGVRKEKEEKMKVERRGGEQRRKEREEPMRRMKGKAKERFISGASLLSPRKHRAPGTSRSKGTGSGPGAQRVCLSTRG